MRDELDTLIDDTARAMTAVPAPASIATGVRARIAGGERRWTPAWMAATVAAALALIIVATTAWWPRTTPAVATLPSTQRAAQDLVLRMPSAASIPREVPPPSAPIVARAKTRRPPVSRMADVAPLDVMPLVIEPLAQPRLIAIDTSTQVMPIEIDLLQIEPLDTQ